MDFSTEEMLLIMDLKLKPLMLLMICCGLDCAIDNFIRTPLQ